MNKIYKIIWSKARNCYIVVSEIAKRNGKCSSSLNKKIIASFLAAGTVLSVTGSAWAGNNTVTIKGNGNSAPNVTNSGGDNAVIIGKTGATHGSSIVVIGDGAKNSTDITSLNGSRYDYLYGDRGYHSDGEKIVYNGSNGIAIGTKAWSHYVGGDADMALFFGKSLAELPEGIAIGTNSYARNGSIMLGQHDYTGPMGDTTVEADKNNKNNLSVAATTIGYASSNMGNLATLTGSYSVISEYESSKSSERNVGAVVYGSLNSIESKETLQGYAASRRSGIANSVVGVANRTNNANTAMIFGAGNQISNSIVDVTPSFYQRPGKDENGKALVAGYAQDALELQNKMMKHLQDDKGGSVIAIGTGNTADSTIFSQLNGVGNTLSATTVVNTQKASDTDEDTYPVAEAPKAEDYISAYNQLSGYVNEGTDIRHVTVTGANNTIKNTTGAIVTGDNNSVTGSGIPSAEAESYDNILLIGNNRTVTGAKNTVILGSGKTTTTAENAVIIGQDANAEVDGGVALGANTVADRAKGVFTSDASGKAVNGKNAYDPIAVGQVHDEADTSSTWVSKAGAVSVGNSTTTRQITNVAAGSAETDAVNVAQLKQVVTAVDGAKTHYYHVNSTVTGAGSNYDNDGATGTNALAAGPNAKAAGDTSIAIGYGATIIKSETSTSGLSSIAIGTAASAGYKSNNIAIGINAKGTGQGAVAIGNRAVATNAESSNVGSVAIGEWAESSKTGSVAIGKDSKSDASWGTVVGYKSVLEPGGSGTAGGTNSSVFGANNKLINSDDSLIVGSNNTLNTEKSRPYSDYIIGDHNVIEKLTHSLVIGEENTIKNTVSTSQSEHNRFIGSNNSVSTVVKNSTVIGNNNSLDWGESNLVIGDGHTLKGTGSSSSSFAKNNIILGAWDKKDSENQPIIHGQLTNSDTPKKLLYTVMIGRNADAQGNFAVAIGDKTEASEGAVSIGPNADAEGKYAVTIGNGTKASEKAVSLGNEASATKTGGVALGSKSIAETDKGVVGYDVLYADHKADKTGVWKSTAAAVSVGGTDSEGVITTRQITNVAAGLQDTDAVNVAQLKRAETHYYSVKSDKKVKGSNYLNDGATGTDALAAGPSAQATADNAVAVGNGANASGAGSIALGNGSTVSGENSIAIGKGHTVSGKNSGALGDPSTITGDGSYAVGNDNTISTNKSFALGNNTEVAYEGSVALGQGSKALKADAPSTGGYNPITNKKDYTDGTNTWTATTGPVSVGSKDVTRQIKYVAAGNEDTDAVNVAQLKQVASGLTHDYSVNSVLPATDSNYNNKGATGNNALAAGVSAKAQGYFSTVVGDKSEVLSTTRNYTVNVPVIGERKIPYSGVQGVGAVNVGAMNSIGAENNDAYGFDGVANSVIGVANKTEKANGAIIMGAGNVITNSYDDEALKAALKENAAALLSEDAATYRKLVKDAGGDVLAIGGANEADYAVKSSMIGVKNKIIGTSNSIAELNSSIGYSNTIENGSNNSIIGTNRKVSDVNGVIIIGSADPIGYTEEEKPQPIPLPTSVENAVVIGTNANVKVKDGVALGSGSVTAESVSTTSGYDMSTGKASTDTSATWLPTLGEVSVGIKSDANGKQQTRRITNVAAGSDPTDAVNVAQLKTARVELQQGTNTVLGKETAETDGHTIYTVNAYDTQLEAGTGVTVEGGDLDTANVRKYTVKANLEEIKDSLDPLKFGGDNTTPDTNIITRKLGQQLDVIGGAKGTLTEGNIGVISNGVDTLEVKLSDKINLTADGSLTVGEAATGATVVYQKGIRVIPATGSVMTQFTSEGISAGNQKIENVAAGTALTDAVNVSQLQKARTTVTGGANVSVNEVLPTGADGNYSYTIDVDNLTYKANGENAQSVKLSDGLNFTDGKNTTAEVAANGVVKINTGKSVVKAADGDNNVTVTASGPDANLVTTYDVAVADMHVKEGTASYGNVSGGTAADGTITLTHEDGTTATITGLKNTYTTAGAFDASTKKATFTRNDTTTYDLDLSAVSTSDYAIEEQTVSADKDGNVTLKVSDRMNSDDSYNVVIEGVATKDDVAKKITFKDGDNHSFAAGLGDEVTVNGENGITIDAKNTNTYTIGIDGATAAAEIPLTYKANGANAQSVKLSDGLNFTDGKNTTATVAADGVVTINATHNKVTGGNATEATEKSDAVSLKLTDEDGNDIPAIALKNTYTTVTKEGNTVTFSRNDGVTETISLSDLGASDYRLVPADGGKYKADSEGIVTLKVKDAMNEDADPVEVMIEDVASKTQQDINTENISTNTANITKNREDLDAGWNAKAGGSTINVNPEHKDLSFAGADEHVTVAADDNTRTIKIGVTGLANEDLSNITEDGETVITNIARDAVTVEGGNGIKVTQSEDKSKYKVEAKLADNMTFREGNIDLANVVKIGNGTGVHTVIVDGTKGDVTGLTNTTWSKDGVYNAGRAATEEQLQDLYDAATKDAVDSVKLKFQGENTDTTLERGNNEVLQVVGDGENITVKGENDKLNVLLSKDLNVDSVTAGDTVINTDGVTANKVTVGDTVIEDKKITMGNTEITDSSVTTKEVKAGNTTINDSGVTTNNVTVGDTTINSDGLTIVDGPSITKDGVDAGSRKITNVADGTEDSDAVNLSQLKQATSASRTEVEGGTNIASVEESTGKDGQSIYTVNADGASVSAGSDAVKVTKGAKDKDTNITDYEVDLSDKTKAALDKAENEGLTFAGDTGTSDKIKLGDTLNLKGGATGNLSDGNIGVEADGSTLNIKLAREIKDVDTIQVNKSVTVGDTTIDGDGVTSNKFTAGDTTVSSDGLKIEGGPSVTKGGVDAGGQKVTNVAPGEADTDAANMGQLYQVAENAGAAINNVSNQVNNLDSRMKKGLAGAAALAALHPMDFDPDDKLTFAAGMGNYRGQNAAAIGAFYRPDEKVMFSVGGTMGNGENMVNAGISFSLDRVNRVTTSRTAMAHEIVELRKHIAHQDSQIAQLTQLVNKLVGPEQQIQNASMFPDVPENHWAYAYLEDLQKRGIVEGYPDGQFRGDRSMTRYEFAAMLDRALRKGEPLDARIAKEFEPELGRIYVERIKGQDQDRHKIERVRVNNKDTKTRDVYGTKIS